MLSSFLQANNKVPSDIHVNLRHIPTPVTRHPSPVTPQISSSLVPMVSGVGSVIDKSPAINIPARITENKMYSQSFGALNVEGAQVVFLVFIVTS